MTEKALYSRLTRILEAVDVDDYPELCETIWESISDEGIVEMSAYHMARALQDADPAAILPQEAARLLIEIYLEEIKNGNAAAMTCLGALYYTGRCGEQSYKKAMKYYRMADRLGYLQATENLGYCYYYGRVGKTDYKKAYHWFIKGALAGGLNSRYKIGDMYRFGYYVEKDERLAMRIYTECYQAREGADDCRIAADICLRMGDVYCEGIGTGKNPGLALKYYQEAERHFYRKIEDGDFFARKGLEKAIERQNAIRKELQENLPGFDWRQ